MNEHPESEHRISVIIPNWNGAAHLPECMDSLQAQTFPDFEVMVVDNGSTDDSVALIKERYPRVQVLALGRNTGFSGAVNAGIRATRGEYVVLLNNDTRAEPDWLENLVRAMDEVPDASMGASKMLRYEPPHDIDAAGDGYSLWHGAGINIGAGEPHDSYAERAWVFGACAGAAIYRRSLFEDIGLFDEDFFLVFEDIDFDLRAQVAGHRCLYVPDAVVYHKRGASTDNQSYAVKTRAWRNLIWVAGKNLPPGLLAVWAFFFLLRVSRVFASAILYRLLGITRRDNGARADADTEEPRPAATWRQGVLKTYYFPALSDGLKRLPRKRRETRALRRRNSLRLAPVLLRAHRRITS